MKFFALPAFVLLFVSSTEASDAIIDYIDALKTTWRTSYNPNDFERPFMDSEEKVTLLEGRKIKERVNLDNFDARTKWPNCTSIGQIFDQGLCSPSWIYAAVGQMADRICIKTGQNIDVKATVENMMKGNYDCNSSYNSADIGKAFQYWRENGIFVGKKTSPEKRCSPFLKQYQNHDGNETYIYLSVEAYNPYSEYELESDMFALGPVSFRMDVTRRMLRYKSGFYSGDRMSRLGYHAVKCIGWGYENEVFYWIVANSWGTEWGDKGYIKLTRGFDQHGITSRPCVKLGFAEAPNTCIDDQQLFITL